MLEHDLDHKTTFAANRIKSSNWKKLQFPSHFVPQENIFPMQGLQTSCKNTTLKAPNIY